VQFSPGGDEAAAVQNAHRLDRGSATLVVPVAQRDLESFDAELKGDRPFFPRYVPLVTITPHFQL
jgi:hypothetical protein